VEHGREVVTPYAVFASPALAANDLIADASQCGAPWRCVLQLARLRQNWLPANLFATPGNYRMTVTTCPGISNVLAFTLTHVLQVRLSALMALLAFANEHSLAEGKLAELLERSGHSHFNEDARNDILGRVRREGSCLRLLRSGLRPLACGGLAALVGIVATQGARAQANLPPTLTEIVPASGPAGPAYPLHVTIRGTGFMPTGNVVRFGPVTIPNVSSPDGSRINVLCPEGDAEQRRSSARRAYAR